MGEFATAVRTSWTLRLALGILFAALMSLTLTLAPVEPVWLFAFALGAMAGAGVGLLGRYPARWIAVAAFVTALCAALGALITRSIVAVALIYLVGGVLDFGLMSCLRFRDRYVIPVLFLGAAALTCAIWLSFRAFVWGWFGAPVYVALMPFVVLPAALLLSPKDAGVRRTGVSS